jgi:uncharacterized DUF497 family protein
MIYIESISIDDHILEKIESKHRVLFGDVEEVLYSDNYHVRKGRDGLYKVFGKTMAGRHLLVVLVNKDLGDWKIVTARDMTENEKRLYKKAVGGK